MPSSHQSVLKLRMRERQFQCPDCLIVQVLGTSGRNEGSIWAAPITLIPIAIATTFRVRICLHRVTGSVPDWKVRREWDRCMIRVVQRRCMRKTNMGACFAALVWIGFRSCLT